MAEPTKRKLIQRILIIVSGSAFLGLMVIPLMEVFKQDSSPTQQASTSSAQGQQLQQIAQGYEAVLKREPNNVSALQGLAEARLNLQDFSGAVEPVKKLHALDPANLQYIGVLTQLYQRNNDVTGAQELTPKVEKLAQSDPNNPQYIMILTQLYRQTNNTSESTKLENQVEKLVQADPNNPQYLQILAQLRLQANNLPGALETMKKLQQSYPEDEQLKVAIQKIEEAIKQQDQALPIPLPSPLNNE
ncbi:TPR domain protein [Gloeothece citriformis PCC 7424]|uniref:TPR domain protein n=1 Tax=Gloeothece citriformis (strain PCC 7424) TaxID=65393 RepID=B7KGI6_GLOC7|nr:hypothetical protein [Gloeothece citriformis]ACK71913.1 TPR domain protein [Gloeothece citriformis PCC 7424]